MLLWPSEDMDFWKIESDEDIVTVKWSHNYFEDYKILSYQFFECGNRTFDEVIEDVNDNIKSDMWFLPGIFLIRQSIELGLKALLCRIYNKNKDIQNTFEECCHDVSKLFQKYIVIGEENYLTNKEREWLINYLLSLEDVDSKSDMFRFPFEDEFLSKYQGKFLDNVGVANNLLQAFALVKKCLKKGIPDDPTGNGGGFVFDCRAVNNPGKYERYKAFTGLDEPVITFLEEDGEILRFLDHVYALVDASVKRYMERGFSNLSVCFGCTGGQHRSVYSAQHLAERLNREFGVKVELVHREQNIKHTFEATI